LVSPSYLVVQLDKALQIEAIGCRHLSSVFSGDGPAAAVALKARRALAVAARLLRCGSAPVAVKPYAATGERLII
jgi:hypothetical protein